MRRLDGASATLLALISLLGCGETEPAKERVLREPILGSPELAGGLPARWLRSGERWQRTLPCTHDCRFEVPASDRGGATLVAEAAVAPTGSATFRVRLDGAVLAETRAEAGRSQPIHAVLPEAVGHDAVLTLEIEIAPNDEREETAFFLDPAFERRITRERQSPEHAWNVLLITSDTTRRDELSCYGGPVATPAIDELAAEGVLFSEVHSVAFGTLPSHASLMTSRHARGHGVHRNGAKLSSELPLLAELLRDRGFSTAAFVSSAVLERRLGLARGFDLYDGPRGERRGDMTTSLFEGWLERLSDEPFFAWVHLFDAHQPYRPPASYAAPYLREHASLADEVDGLIASLPTEGRAQGFVRAEAIAAASPNALSHVDAVARARYRGEIAFVDSQVRRLREALEDRGLASRTLVVFTADHGENFLDRGPFMAFDHAGLHGDVTRLPLVVRRPDGRFAGRREPALASNLDIGTTILAALGVPAPPTWLGRDLLAADSVDAPTHLVLEGSRSNEIAIRTPRWLYRESRSANNPRRNRNLGFAADRTVQLYDVSRDPEEQRDLSLDADADSRLALSALKEIAGTFRAEAGAPEADPLLATEHLEALRALGYVEAP